MNIWLPIALMATFALTRWPGLLPPNFSAAYALAFCAGVYFPRRLAWWLPLATLLATDLALNAYYFFGMGINAFKWTQLFNYVSYAMLIWLGKNFQPKSSLLSLLSGGILGAILFYLITNTASWFFNPFQNLEYTRTPHSWFIALTKGIHGYPETWQFFNRTLLSGGLFTGLFAGAMKLTCPESQAEKDVPESEPEEGPKEGQESEA
ncbi:MAG TPA: DUF6580 family putative transport protein [Verrucomicrobiae bacterium]